MTPTSLLSALNLLLVGVWVGMYLFTTFVVSPAFVELFPDPGVRTAHRRRVGGYYARVNGPVTALLLATVLALGALEGFRAVLLAEVAVLFLIAGLVALHVRRGRAQGRPPAWITNVTLGAGAALCALAVAAHA